MQLMTACHAGIMARTVAGICFLDSILSSCNTTAENVELDGLRIGFAANWWTQIATEVRCACSCLACRVCSAAAFVLNMCKQLHGRL